MITLDWTLLIHPVWSIFVMLAWYVVGIQYERGGVFVLLAPFTFLGFIYDRILQRTYARLWFWEIEPDEEFTITMRLVRLVKTTGWRGDWARFLAKILNFFAPNHNHVPLDDVPTT